MAEDETRPGRPGRLPRRRMLALVVLAPAAVALASGCSATDTATSHDIDLLRGLAEAARSDAALAAAALAANPQLTERVDPLRAARLEHAAALEAEISRIAPDTARSASGPGAAASNGGDDSTTDRTVTRVGPPTTLAQIREAAAASARAAGEAALGLSVEHVGLVASITACCATYAAVLE